MDESLRVTTRLKWAADTRHVVIAFGTALLLSGTLSGGSVTEPLRQLHDWRAGS